MPPTSKPIRLLAGGIYNIRAIKSFLFEDHGYKNKKESGGYFGSPDKPRGKNL